MNSFFKFSVLLFAFSIKVQASDLESENFPETLSVRTSSLSEISLIVSNPLFEILRLDFDLFSGATKSPKIVPAAIPVKIPTSILPALAVYILLDC